MKPTEIKCFICKIDGFDRPGTHTFPFSVYGLWGKFCEDHAHKLFKNNKNHLKHLDMNDFSNVRLNEKNLETIKELKKELKKALATLRSVRSHSPYTKSNREMLTKVDDKIDDIKKLLENIEI